MKSHAFRNPKALHCGAPHRFVDDESDPLVEHLVVGGQRCALIGEGSKLLYAADPCEACLRAYLPPKHEHDCEACRYLGQVQDGGDVVDVYWHVSSTSSLASVIGRRSSEGHDYASSNPPEAFSGPGEYLMRNAPRWYLYALAVAARRGLWLPAE